MAGVHFRAFQLIPKYLLARGFRMSAQLRSEKVVEEMKKSNPYFEKYSGKIATLQQSSPEEFMQRVDTQAEKSKPKKEPTRNYEELLNPKKDIKSTTTKTNEKKLSDVMKLELVQDKTADEIRQIWIEYHKTKDVVAATVPIAHFDKLITNGKKYPIFILPLPRSEGYEFIVLQFSGNTVHFTPLLCYQVHKENAPECLNIVHYTELRDKGVILMRGEYDNKVLTPQEAQCLANQVQLYYCREEPSKLQLLETFNKRPDSFKHGDLIKEMENIKIE